MANTNVQPTRAKDNKNIRPGTPSKRSGVGKAKITGMSNHPGPPSGSTNITGDTNKPPPRSVRQKTSMTAPKLPSTGTRTQ